MLRQLRVNAGLSQRQVSEAMGYTTPQFISNWERGVSYPPIKDIKRLARILKVDAGFLFGQITDARLSAEKRKLVKQFERSKS